MGTGHAVSGAAVWLVGWSWTAIAGLSHPHADVLTVGTLITAAGALVNDLDHPSARLAQLGGRPTQWVAKNIGRLGASIHAATKLDADRPDEDGHRTITHTFVFAALTGVVVAAVAGLSDQLGVWLVHITGWPGAATGNVLLAGIVFTFVKLGYAAARSAFGGRQRRMRIWPGKRRRWRKSTVIAWAATVYAYVMLPVDVWWLGLAVGVGLAVHCLGDMLTIGGCPILWPVPIPGRAVRYDRQQRRKVKVWVWRTWYLVGTPRWMRFPVGQAAEKHVTHGIILFGVLAVAGLAYATWWGAGAG